MKDFWSYVIGIFWTALFSQVLQHVCSAPAAVRREYIIRYQIPGASLVHWNYHPESNYNHKYGPLRVPATQDKLLPLQPQVIPTATPPCTSTARTITTTQATPTQSPSEFGNKPSADHKDDEALTEGFLEWLDKNPVPKQQQAVAIKPDDQDEFPVLQPEDESEHSDFAFLYVPSRGVKCPSGQRLVDGVCRRQLSLTFRPRPRPRL